jgi:hypothetical protein
MKSHLSILIRFHQQTLFLHRKSGVNHNFHITNETLINGIYFLIDFAVLWHWWIMRCSRGINVYITEMGWRGKDWQRNMNVSSHCINGFFDIITRLFNLPHYPSIDPQQCCRVGYLVQMIFFTIKIILSIGSFILASSAPINTSNKILLQNCTYCDMVEAVNDLKSGCRTA